MYHEENLYDILFLFYLLLSFDYVTDSLIPICILRKQNNIMYHVQCMSCTNIYWIFFHEIIIVTIYIYIGSHYYFF